MAFVVQCPFCKFRARAPERAKGAIGHCAKCANSFTLAPLDDNRFAEPELPPVEPIAPPQEEAIANQPIPGISTSAATLAAELAAPFDASALADVSASQNRPGAALGAVALVFGGLAFVCGLAQSLCSFVLPLAGLGLIMGIAGALLALRSTRPRFLLPIGGGAASTVVLALAFFAPALLGPTYLRARQGTRPDSSQMRAIPLPGAPTLAKVPDWIDAQKYALVRSNLRVQVVSVSANEAPDIGESEPAPPDLLVVRVRITQLGLGQASSRADKPFSKAENRPKLNDSAGKSYALQRTDAFGPVGTKRRSDLFPAQTADQTFAFAAPRTGWESLQLELPGAAVDGGGGPFRFSIPTSMVSTPRAAKTSDKLSKDRKTTEAP